MKRSRRSDPLSPIHHSLRQTHRVHVMTPRNMDCMEIDPAHKQKMDAHALEIFTDCANAGLPFADCLGAVFFSGMAWVMSAADVSVQAEKPAERAKLAEAE